MKSWIVRAITPDTVFERTGYRGGAALAFIRQARRLKALHRFLRPRVVPLEMAGAALIVFVAFVMGCLGATPVEASDGGDRISNAEAREIVRKNFSPICGAGDRFRCPHALEDQPTCPFEAIVLLPLGENNAYDGRSLPVWIALSAQGRVLRISDDRTSVCPMAKLHHAAEH